jgi:hypothetical protein
LDYLSERMFGSTFTYFHLSYLAFAACPIVKLELI